MRLFRPLRGFFYWRSDPRLTVGCILVPLRGFPLKAKKGSALRTARADVDYFVSAIVARAASTTLSGLKPNFFNTSFNGAEDPNVCIPITLPCGPTYCDQPNVDACSTATRAFISCGNVCCLYSSLCLSKMAQEGMLTTRAFTPSDFNCS